MSYVFSDTLRLPGIRHLFTTRSGGVSTGVFAEMNLAAGSGEVRDSMENVVRNHDICARFLGYTAADVCRTVQEHTARVETVTLADKGRGLVTPPFGFGVDGIVTADSGIVLSVRGADCATLLAADTAHGVIGALHSGWRGTLHNAAGNLICKMFSLGATADCIHVAVGPCIKSCCYEIDGTLFEQFAEKGYDYAFTPKGGGKYMLELTEIIGRQLISAGIPDAQIDIIPDCTCCNEDYFSHRRMGVNRGTGGAMIVRVC